MESQSQNSERRFSPEEVKSRCSRRLTELLENYSNEVPEKIVHSYDDDNQYKVRAAWWTSLRINFDIANKYSLLSDSITEKFETIYARHLEDLEKDRLTKGERIQEMNLVLQEIIDHLKVEA